ncbi:hypothetical protein [Variovorax guangxiensis]|uniref:Uncharacterized protein n=1 Tax=Variovorax guangxiensis TaxID=1775474 RepID=A0A840G3R2_9BURK|nr:hypothetical protein [Variovorax guangxiensis]MBB4223921.1 hypothetical protein [Variovorax guangxiensis]
MSSIGKVKQENASKANRGESPLLYAGPLAVGDYSSEMGPFKAWIKSLGPTPAILEFEITGSDGTGDFEVSGMARSGADGWYRCFKAPLHYPGLGVADIPTALAFEIREVAAQDQRFCYVSLSWGEEGTGTWIAHGLLSIKPD